MSALIFYRVGGLHAKQLPEGLGGSNGLQAYLEGNTLWLTDAERMSCADPVTGKDWVQVKSTGHFSGVPVQADGHIYMWAYQGLAVMRPTMAGCL